MITKRFVLKSSKAPPVPSMQPPTPPPAAPVAAVPPGVPAAPPIQTTSIPGSPPPPPPVITMVAPPVLPTAMLPAAPLVPTVTPPLPVGYGTPTVATPQQPVMPPPAPSVPSVPLEPQQAATPPFSTAKRTSLEDLGDNEPVFVDVPEDVETQVDGALDDFRTNLLVIISESTQNDTPPFDVESPVATGPISNPFKPKGPFKDEYKMFDALGDGQFHAFADVKETCGSKVADTTFKNKLKKLAGLSGADLVEENDFFKLEFK